MCSKGFIRRILPFFATFAIGVFIASFFVTIGGQRWRGGERGRRYQEMQQLRMENQELKNENLRLKNDLDGLRWNHEPDEHFMPGLEEVPPPPLAPSAPHAKR